MTSTQVSSEMELFQDACEVLAAGVTSMMRLHRGINRPFYVTRASGSKVYDCAGNEYVDINTGNGSILLGHGHAAVTAALHKAIAGGVSASAEIPQAVELAAGLRRLFPCGERWRFCLSGTEGTAYSVRVARGFTGKPKVAKFEGNYHGYGDTLGYSAWPPVNAAGDPLRPQTVPGSQGMIPGAESSILVLPYNDLAATSELLTRHRSELAALIMEPVSYSLGCVAPEPGFLEGVRKLTTEYGIVLIFDEILSGFRTGPGGMTAHYGIQPDMIVISKALAHGLPLCAFGGRRDIMEVLAPKGGVIQSGTSVAHPLSVAVALAMLKEIERPELWAHLRELEDYYYPRLVEVFRRRGAKARIQWMGNRVSFYFGIEEPVRNYRDWTHADRATLFRFFGEILNHGVYTVAHGHHGITEAHTVADIDRVLEGFDRTLAVVKW